VAIIVAGLISLFTSIISLSIMLKKSGADISYMQLQNKALEKDIFYKTRALMHSLQELQDIKCQGEMAELSRQFIISQSLWFENQEVRNCDLKSRLQERYKSRLSDLARALHNKSMAASDRITSEDVNLYIKTLKSQTTKGCNNNDFNSPIVLTVEHLMSHTELQPWLRFVIENGMSLENWYFIIAMKEYQSIQDFYTKLDEAFLIYDLFIKDNSVMQINIPSTQVSTIQKLLNSSKSLDPTSLNNLFQPALSQVIQLIQHNNINSLRDNEMFNHHEIAFSQKSLLNS